MKQQFPRRHSAFHRLLNLSARNAAIILLAAGVISASQSLPATADPLIARKTDALLIKKSDTTVAETLDRLTAALEKKGIQIFARVDHAAGAEKVGMALPPTQLLIFGNPKLGTPLMQTRRAVGIDLPMKALAWADDDGNVYLGYTNPGTLRDRHVIAGRDDIIEKMAAALDKLTDIATGQQSPLQ